MVGIIKNKYPNLRGSDWIRRIEYEDRKVLSSIGRSHVCNQHGRIGGKIRAMTARRDLRGRFLPNIPIEVGGHRFTIYGGEVLELDYGDITNSKLGANVEIPF